MKKVSWIADIVIVFAVSLALMGCGSPPVAKKVTASPTPTPDLLLPEAIKVDKPVNVSFSTYSKDWPVRWVWIDPDPKNATARDVTKGVLRVTVPSGKDMYGDNRTAPRYVKQIQGDFQIETRVKFLPKENYQGGGLLIYKDDNNYLRFERAFGGIGGGGEGIRLDVRKGDEYTPIVTPNEIQTDAGEVDLKIVRSGQTFTAYWRLDEESEWREAGEFVSDYSETVMAGLIACNTAREITAEFAFIRLLPTPKKAAN